jgi:hypothetical protein
MAVYSYGMPVLVVFLLVHEFPGRAYIAVAGEPAPKVEQTEMAAAPKATTASRYEKIVVQRWEEAATPAEVPKEQQAPRTFEPKSPEFYRMINDIERWRFNASAVEVGQVPAVASVVDFELIPDLSPDDAEKHSASKYGASPLVVHRGIYKRDGKVNARIFMVVVRLPVWHLVFPFSWSGK